MPREKKSDGTYFFNLRSMKKKDTLREKKSYVASNFFSWSVS